MIISKKGEIDLKGPKNSLSRLREIRREINYPYMYVLQKDQDMFQACTVKQCFAFSKNPKELQQQIDNYLKNQ